VHTGQSDVPLADCPLLGFLHYFLGLVLVLSLRLLLDIY
jgi:hypothetical protein